jgi:recombinational DNA repair protein RecT
MIRGWLSNPETKAKLDQALMGWLPGDAFAEQCLMVARDPKLSRCTADSLLAAFLQCAQLGLMPGAQKVVQLIARGQSVDVMITARGFKTLMERLPDVRRITAVLVHSLDEWNGADPITGRPLHVFDPLKRGRSFSGPDDLLGGYVHAFFVDGAEAWHYVSAEEIDACRRCAKSQTVWQKWFRAMALKTLYRQAWARMFLPMGTGTAAALAVQAADTADRLAMREHYDHDADRVQVAPAARALTYDDIDPGGPPQDASGGEVIVAE